jgi:DNA mismatch endonuclease (patch repair protein)
MMAGIRGKNTRPEMLLRRGLHARGLRYRLHQQDLPGKPDLVFPARRAVIFVHGCFWHQHECHLFKWPGSRPEFWKAKLSGNREVDARAIASLQEAGWRTGVVWECALRGRARLPLDEVLDRCAGWVKGGATNLEIAGVPALHGQRVTAPLEA